MWPAVNHFSRDHERVYGTRQEQRSIPNTLQVAKAKQEPRNPDSLISMARGPALEWACRNCPKSSKLKRRRKKQKLYITTKTEIQKHSCQDADCDNESMRCHIPKFTSIMEQEHDHRSLTSSSSTPRVLTYAEPRKVRYQDATEESECKNLSLNVLDNACIHHGASDLKSEDPPLPCSTDDSRLIRQFHKLAIHQKPTLDYNHSQSAPILLPNRSQIQFHENSRRNSDPNHVYWEAPSFGPEVSPHEKAVHRSILCDDLSPSALNKSSRVYAGMDNFSATADLPDTQNHFEPSPKHMRDDVSAFELSMLYDQWTHISQMRSHIAGLRLTLRVMRQKLRALQTQKCLTDDAYFKQVKMREYHMPFPRSWWSEKSLDELLYDAQKVRDEYGPLEDEYTNAEDDLTSQEYQLSEYEEHFYNQLQNPSRFFPASIKPGNSLGLPIWAEQTKPHKPHPLMEKYLSKLGDLDILRERYDDILDEKLILEEELGSRKRFNMTLMPENQQWLDSSQSLLDDLTSKIQVAEIEERELRQECFSLGLVDQNGEPTESSISVQLGPTLNTVSETIDNPHEYVRSPSPFSSASDEPEINMEELNSDHNFLARNERFDRWALEKLQISLVEINIYANCSKHYNHSNDLGKLKGIVCKKDFMAAWFMDGFTDNAPRSADLTPSHSISQYIPNTTSSYSKVSPSDVVFSNGSSNSRSEHSDSAEEGAKACIVPISNIVSTAIAI